MVNDLSDPENLETIQNIFEQISDNIPRDCSNIIDKILKTVEELNLKQTENLSSNVYFKKAFSSIKSVLQLLKEVLKANNANQKLFMDRLLRNVKYILENFTEPPDDDFQQDLLVIVYSLFEIAFFQNSSEDFCQLADFYQYNLDWISLNSGANHRNLLFRLKILSSIYSVFSFFLKNSQNSVLHQEILRIIKSDECKVFLKLVLHPIDDVAIQTSLFVIPEYVNCYKSSEVFEFIWREISNLMGCQNECDIKNSRILLIMCYFFNMCFDECVIEGEEEKLVSLFFNDVNYWSLIQSCLVEQNPMMRKQSMYLFKKAMSVLKMKNLKIKSFCKESNENMIFWWDTQFKDCQSNIYTEMIVILEFLDEQQTHIIKPIFQKVEKLLNKFLEFHKNGQKIDFSWIILLHEKALMHDSTQVVKWGLSNLLKLPEELLSQKSVARKLVSLLVSTLKNMNIYYSDGLSVSNELTEFFQRMTKCATSRYFFCLFIREICCWVWSPEALFFVVRSLSPIRKHLFWGEEEISQMKTFVSRAFKTHNKIIRCGVQCELLNSITGLTDEGNVPLEKVILLLSSFSSREALKMGSRTWDCVSSWLREAYPRADAERILEQYQNGDLESEFNEKSIAFMLNIFYSAYGMDSVLGTVFRIVLSFKDIEKRLYCDTSLYNHYEMIICCICEEYSGPLSQCMIPHLPDILCFIGRELKSMSLSSLKDFDSCQLHIRILEVVLKVGGDWSNVVRNLHSDILKNLEQSSGVPSLRIYCGMKFLKSLLEARAVEPSDSLIEYLSKEVNEPLMKDEGHSEMAKNVQMLWGRMNSEFLEEKWKILEFLIKKRKMRTLLDRGDLRRLCSNALYIGGYGVLCPVMSILEDVLPDSEDESEVREIIACIWTLIMERRKTEEFKSFIKHFVEMLFQEEFIRKNYSRQKILKEYVDLIFSDSSLVVVNIFMKHVQKMEVTDCSMSLLSHTLGKGLIFGPVQMKDERLTVQVCSHIETFNICPVSEYNTSNEIRARAVQKILTLNKDNPTHQVFARSLMDSLLMIENDMNKNRTRYFKDSHVHRVKHRLMQALLLLEPLLDSNKVVEEELSKWLYHDLTTENPQPSVKYQQEWLLVRVLIKSPDMLKNFWSHFDDSLEIKTKGICTLIAVAYHLCKLVPADDTAVWIDRAIPTLLPFAMDQHFEVRLYAQVVLQKLYELARRRKLNEILEKYKTVDECVLQSIERGSKGNAGKNCVKLQEDFYLNIFHPVDHYSLQTIFVDLPRLANIGSDEWIPVEIFKNCGVEEGKIKVIPKSVDNSLEGLESAKWLVEKSHPEVSAEVVDEKPEDYLGNFQKKIIPVKELVPGLDKAQNTNLKKDGLVVVASLIDRLPNLGGLARTCEIFGASEYVINSLKYLEDTQFTSLSVTAEKWITVKEVKTQNLLNYVLEMKACGYTVVGAEQALYSQPLSSVKFPKKSLLLLGNEREGIPPNLLPVLDVCVEIPQVGIIRSLNVHVTGALFIWEYAKQNYFSS